jgi:hypothetical protein
MHGAVPQLPYMPSWCDIKLSIGYIFMAWYLVEHRDNFSLPLPYQQTNKDCLQWQDLNFEKSLSTCEIPLSDFHYYFWSISHFQTPIPTPHGTFNMGRGRECNSYVFAFVKMCDYI